MGEGDEQLLQSGGGGGARYVAHDKHSVMHKGAAGGRKVIQGGENQNHHHRKKRGLQQTFSLHREGGGQQVSRKPIGQAQVWEQEGNEKKKEQEPERVTAAAKMACKPKTKKVVGEAANQVYPALWYIYPPTPILLGQGVSSRCGW